MIKEFFKKFGAGAVIGAAMIIPGVSGGTIAVLLNIYDKLITAISSLKKDFKNSNRRNILSAYKAFRGRPLPRNNAVYGAYARRIAQALQGRT